LDDTTQGRFLENITHNKLRRLESDRDISEGLFFHAKMVQYSNNKNNFKGSAVLACEGYHKGKSLFSHKLETPYRDDDFIEPQ
jgi:hypothetical protein